MITIHEHYNIIVLYKYYLISSTVFEIQIFVYEYYYICTTLLIIFPSQEYTINFLCGKTIIGYTQWSLMKEDISTYYIYLSVQYYIEINK